MYLSSSRYWISATCCVQMMPFFSPTQVPKRLSTAEWITDGRMDGGGTSTGPFGFRLMLVRSLLHAAPAQTTTAAATRPSTCFVVRIGRSPVVVTAGPKG